MEFHSKHKKQKKHRYSKVYILLFVLGSALLFFGVKYTLEKIDPLGVNRNTLQAPSPQTIDSLLINSSNLSSIDTTKIITDTLSGRKVISNLLNIALKDERIDLKEFLTEFYANFNINVYQLSYADTNINRMQFKASKAQLSILKKALRRKLADYKILIWDEVLFASNFDFNDQALKQKNYEWYFKVINAQKAWNVTMGDPQVIVAVIDNGFDLKHPELKGRWVKPYNVVKKNSNVSPAKLNHGTHVAGTISGIANNRIGLLGLAPNCKLMPIKISDENDKISNSYIIDGILYAVKNNADVINLSVGMMIDKNFRLPIWLQQEFITFFAKDEEIFWNELFAYAAENNTTCVIAAGNHDFLTGFDPFQRCLHTIKVGSIGMNMQKSGFSNFGAYTDIYAPGELIYSASPGNKFQIMDGTSMSAPLVSAAVALLKSKVKDKPNSYYLNQIKKSISKKNGLPILDLKYLFLGENVN